VPVVLHHTETGPAGAPPLVFLHGFMGRSGDWAGVTEPLAESFRCVMLDLPGHGRSVGLPDEAYTWEGALALVATTLDALGLRRFRMVGYSMGGRMALGFAVRHPRRAARLVLVGASPGLPDDDARAERRRLDDERARALETDLDAFLRVWYRLPLFASLDDRPALREALIASRRRNDPAELARALRGLSTGEMPSYWDALDDLGAPTLAVAGAQDPKFVGVAHRMSALGMPVLPRILPVGGHTLPAEQPALLAEAIRTFCSDALLRPPAPSVTRAA
jgi:2-succinyl-6-hydroxy-2,4-cyclohexadiene-1-carboxylate synthase